MVLDATDLSGNVVDAAARRMKRQDVASTKMRLSQRHSIHARSRFAGMDNYVKNLSCGSAIGGQGAFRGVVSSAFEVADLATGFADDQLPRRHVVGLEKQFPIAVESAR